MLAGSTSLTSTVMSVLSLGVVSLLGLGLVVVWALSPIGGQASLRQVTMGSMTVATPTPLKYFVLNGDIKEFENSNRLTFYGIASTVFVAALLAPDRLKQATTDLWGNVKIPMLESYENNSVADDQGWFTIDQTNGIYASWVDIPTSLPIKLSTDDNAKYVMNIETSYLHLECYAPPPNFTRPENTPTGTGVWAATNGNETQRWHADLAHLEPRSFVFGSYYYSGENHGMIQCNVTTTYVELELACPTSSTCAASRIRRSRLDNPPPAFTLLDNYSIRGWRFYAEGFVISVPGENDGTAALSQYVFEGGDKAPEAIAVRLGQMMATYAWCLFTGGAQTSGLAANDAAGVNSIPEFTKVSINTVATTEATRTTSTDVIRCHVGWTVALCIASVVMIIAALVPAVVRHFFIRAPRLMLNFSSLAVRDNPYVALPDSGTFMEAATRAKLLKDFKVQLGDVRPGSEVGRLAIGSIEGTCPNNVVSLRKVRLYE